MDEKKKLYPLKFRCGKFDKSWGTEWWHIADMGFEDSEVENGWLSGNSISDVMETYLERLVGDNVFRFFGRQFPVLVKNIELDGESPVMLHPDDQTAAERYDALGKSELWYVREAADGAKLYIGLKESLSATEFFEKCMSGNIREAMNEIPAVAGQCYMIKPGVLHSASGKLSLTAVMESSDVNYVLDGNDEFDNDTKITLLSESIDVVDLNRYEPGTGLVPQEGDGMFVTLAEEPEFVVTKISLTDPLKVKTGEFESFIEYVCLGGAFSVQLVEDGKTVKYDVNAGEVILIPAETDDFILAPESGDAVLLEVTVRIVETEDEYINKDTEPYLEGEDYGGAEVQDDEEEPAAQNPLGFFRK